MRLDDGRFVVANYGSNEIRFFSSTGEFISSVGRQGEGPGEFQRIETLSRFGADSIAVYDYWLSRVTILGLGGGMGRVISLRGLADRVRQLRAFGDSGFVGLSYSFANGSTEAGKYRIAYAVIRISASGSLVDTLAMLPGLESYRYAGGEILPPFARDGKIGTRGPT
ncbi:MAG: 6-bladed beta-propeller, partial [Longimicrobiales bacterium]|nr:6-bladed beta-propeller [Longimicrobiales bacterium]